MQSSPEQSIRCLIASENYKVQSHKDTDRIYTSVLNVFFAILPSQWHHTVYSLKSFVFTFR
jgi:hypothetical protein